MRYFLLLLIPFFFSCKTADISTDTKTDSVTTVKLMPVVVSIEADTLTDDVDIRKITNARVGAVIASKSKDNISYKLVKKSVDKVELEIIDEGVDTTVFVPETTTTVTKDKTTTVTEKDTAFKNFLDNISYIICIAVAVIVLIFLYRIRK